MTTDYVVINGTSSQGMASHGTVVDHRIGAGMKLRELDDSRRGARFSNRKEDKLLERKLTYLNNQVRE